MQSLNFDEGYKELMINDDPNRVIRFSPSDFSIVERFNEARKRIEQLKAENLTDIKLDNSGEPVDDLEEAAEIMGNLRSFIKEQIDYIFDSPVSDIVFGNKSPLALVKGVTLFERFMGAAQPYIEKEIKTEMAASEKRIKKYTSQVK